MTLHLTIFPTLYRCKHYLGLLQLLELNLSNVSLLQTLKITCPLTKAKLEYVLVYFTENTVMVSSIHCTHYLVSMFYFHTFKFKAPKAPR